MSLYAVTVIGTDRPGIIADVTAALADLGGNLEDSTMTILRGHFAMTLIVSCSASATRIESALAPATSGRIVSVKQVPPEPVPEPVGTGHVLTVHGADRPGIVSAVTRVLADAGGNITDLTTRLSGSLYVLVADVDIPAETDIAALSVKLAAVAERLGATATLRPAEADIL